MKLGYQTITWGGVVGQAQGVTSIKDLFYQTYGSTAKACEDIAAAGYTGIEIFDGNLAEYANDPDSFKSLLSKHKLELVSVYTGANFIYNDILVDEFHKIKQAIALAKSMGAINLIVGGGAKRSTGTTEEDFQMLAKGLDQVTDLAAAAGLTACYHPHLTTIVETTAELDKIMSLSKIHFCPDTAHLTAGGVDAAANFRQTVDKQVGGGAGANTQDSIVINFWAHIIQSSLGHSLFQFILVHWLDTPGAMVGDQYRPAASYRQH